MNVFFPRLAAVVLFAAVLHLTTGCAGNARTAAPDGTIADAGVAADGTPHTRVVHVLVDGRDKGMLPATIRVRRGLGARMVSLWQAGKEIRTYELQTVQTSDGLSLAYSFFGEQTPTSTVYDVMSLPTAGENNFIIPFSPYRLTIEDRVFQLTLIIEE